MVNSDNAVVHRAAGTPFGLAGWLKGAGHNVGIPCMSSNWLVSQAVRQVTTYTRQFAGTHPHFLVSPQGWMRWSGVDEQLKDMCQSDMSEDRVLTKLVTDGGGGIHVNKNWHDAWYSHYRDENVSWAEPAVGSGTTQGRDLILCDSESGNTIAVPAQHGMSATNGVSVSVSHVVFPISALNYAPDCFHMTTASALPCIVLSGLNRGHRIGARHRWYLLLGKLSMDMQRWGAGDNHHILIVVDARRAFYYMGWRGIDPGLWLSEAGACIPETLSLHIFCKMVIMFDVKAV